MKSTSVSFALLALALPLGAQLSSRGPGLSPTQPRATTPTTHTLVHGQPGQRFLVFQEPAARGRGFAVLGTFGPFDLSRAFFLAPGRFDAEGNGTVPQPLPTNLGPQAASLEVVAAYKMGGRLRLTTPVRPFATPRTSHEVLDFDQIKLLVEGGELPPMRSPGNPVDPPGLPIDGEPRTNTTDSDDGEEGAGPVLGDPLGQPS